MTVVFKEKRSSKACCDSSRLLSATAPLRSTAGKIRPVLLEYLLRGSLFSFGRRTRAFAASTWIVLLLFHPHGYNLISHLSKRTIFREKCGRLTTMPASTEAPRLILILSGYMPVQEGSGKVSGQEILSRVRVPSAGRASPRKIHEKILRHIR